MTSSILDPVICASLIFVVLPCYLVEIDVHIAHFRIHRLTEQQEP